jgi:hypothetical protein
MRIFIFSVLALVTIGAVADAPVPFYAPLLKVPDLSPLLTDKEVTVKFSPGVKVLQKAIPELTKDPEIVASMIGAQKALGPLLPQVTGLTLYSLFPLKGPLHPMMNSAKYPKWTKEVEMLERFNDYPILGQVRIEDAGQANRWVDFLRDQIITGGSFACFQPRHGFRLSTAEGDVDILMCYHCQRLGISGTSKLDYSHIPIFSSITGTLINQLFDKLEVKRDKPPEH